MRRCLRIVDVELVNELEERRTLRVDDADGFGSYELAADRAEEIADRDWTGSCTAITWMQVA